MEEKEDKEDKSGTSISKNNYKSKRFIDTSNKKKKYTNKLLTILSNIHIIYTTMNTS